MTRISISDTKNIEIFRRKINRALEEIEAGAGPAVSPASIFAWREAVDSDTPTGEMIDTPDWVSIFTEREAEGGNL